MMKIGKKIMLAAVFILLGMVVFGAVLTGWSLLKGIMEGEPFVPVYEDAAGAL